MGQRARFGILVELIEALDVGVSLARLGGPLIEQGIREEVGSVGVVDPADISSGQLLEDGHLRQLGLQKVIVVLPVTVRGTGGEIRPVGVCGTGDGSEPPVEQHKVLSHGVENGDMIGGVVVDHLGRTRLISRGIRAHLFRDKPSHVRGVMFHLGAVSAVDLHVPTSNAVIWVIGSHILRDRLRAHNRGLGVIHIDRVAVVAVHEIVDGGVVGQASSKVVKGQVFLDQHDHILDGERKRSAISRLMRDCNGTQAEGELEKGGEGADAHIDGVGDGRRRRDERGIAVHDEGRRRTDQGGFIPRYGGDSRK